MMKRNIRPLVRTLSKLASELLTVRVVYNYRTSNAWGDDLALSATYFPHCGLTFAIVFGCSISIEEQILRRLGRVTIEADHPLLMPGILVELERSRHVRIVEQTIDELETQIHEIDQMNEDAESLSIEVRTSQREAKRSAWLDTMYLRNQLINWITNLEKIYHHADELNNSIFKAPEMFSSETGSDKGFTTPSECSDEEEYESMWSIRSTNPRKELIPPRMAAMQLSEALADSQYCYYNEKANEWQEPSQQLGFREFENRIDQVEDDMRRTGIRIKNRVRDIIDEYREKVRDCTMRVDGMAMATQWVKRSLHYHLRR